MRHTKGHSGNRRSHHGLSAVRLSKCPSCGTLHIRHQVCPACGMYRGRLVIDTKAKEARTLKRRQEKLRSRGEDVTSVEKKKSEAPSSR
jgi:large subunit ribosomal protein L32